MRYKPFISVIAFSIGALILGIIAWLSGEIVFGAYALGVLSVGLGVNSLMISLSADRRTNSIEATLTRIESLQEEIKKAQEEKPSSGKPLLAALEGLSQYYFDYIAKQKERAENEKRE
ncbi:MAG: hypothetical protein R6U93_04320 [Dehalococcoidia bacterium]